MTAPGLPAARPAGAGFTLVELLVALTLVGLISLVLFGGLRFGTRAWEAGTSRGEESRRVAIVQSLLRRQLSQAVLPARRSREVDAPQAFDGAAESIQFVAPLSAHVGFGGLYRFELAVERAAARRRLVLRWQP